MSEKMADYRRFTDPATLALRLRRAALVAFDVDGTLTSGQIGFVGGERALFFSSHDGHGIASLLKAGIAVAWVTTNRTMAVRDRAVSLGVTYLIQGREDKKAAIEELKIPWEQIVVVGDDMNDVPAMLAAGVAFAVANAQMPAKWAAHRTLDLPGGHGAAREVCDFVLQAKGYEIYAGPDGCEWRKP